MESIASQTPEPIKLFDKLTLVAGDGEDSGVFFTRIQDLINGGIIISEPEFIRGKTLLRDNLEILVQVTRRDALYQFTSRIRRIQRKGKALIVLSPPQQYRRVQRRMFVRVETDITARYAVIPNAIGEPDWVQQLHWYNSRSYDFSAGGSLLEIQFESLTVGDLLLVELDFKGALEVSSPLAAICRRLTSRDDHLAAGVQFILADEFSQLFKQIDIALLPDSVNAFDWEAQNLLSKSIFDYQVDLRRSGKL